MKHQPHFKIVVLEDNDFYNKLMTQHLKNYIGRVALIKGFTFDISSFTSYIDCVRNFTKDTNIIISDYYLNDGYNATNIIDLVKKRASKCKVIVLSHINNINTTIYSLLEGACEFIFKDKQALEKSGYIVEEIIAQNLKGNLGDPPLN